MAKERGDRFPEVEERYSRYEVYDQQGEKIGEVDDLFVNDKDQPEYIAVKMGSLGTKSTLIPWEIVRLDEQRDRFEVPVDKDRAMSGPAFEDDQEITLESEGQVRSYYGLGAWEVSEQRGAYGEYREASEQDELRVQRVEEELRAGTREREAGRLRVRKRVRTDREQLRVPTKHEEVSVERVPVNQEAPEAEIGEDEVSVPVVEEEVVTEKRPVVKEEVRLRKDVVEEEQVVEEDVRREEIEIEDQTELRRRRGEGATGRTGQPERRPEEEQPSSAPPRDEGLIDKAKRKLQE